MPTVAVTAVGQDRPGIVAEVSGVLFRQGCNLEDASMTRLRDQFAMQLLVRLPEGGSPSELESGLQEAARRLELSLVVRQLHEVPTPADSGGAESYTVRVYGADRPGIVHAVTSLLAAHGANIVDLDTRVVGAGDGSVYVMLLEVETPSGGGGEVLREPLERLRAELQVEIGLSRLDDEAL
jgi:glycine cleavage system transcriptional repressor